MKKNTTFTSYAQNFEDFMLWRALKQINHGFYIDVGACDPIHGSVTKSFYDMGWSGINIEPIAQHYARLLAERSRDVNLNILVSDKNGKTIFYENNESGLSSCIEDHTKSWHEENPSYVFKKVHKVAKTLDTICTENRVKEVHFLKIDVEGFEMNVLRSLSFSAVRPWIVLFEAVASTGNHEDISIDCVLYMQSKKYHQVFFDGLNKFFVSDEHGELDNAFQAPMNTFDQPHLRLYDYHWLVHNRMPDSEIVIDKENDKPVVALNATKSKGNELFTIYNSRGRKVFLFLNKVSNILVPVESSRRMFVKYLLTTPKKFYNLFLKVNGLIKKMKVNRQLNKKINFKAIPQLRFKDTQWGYALDLISGLHNDNGVIFEGALEDSFYFGESERITPETKKWVAISHQPPIIMAEMIKLGKIQKCLKNCKGIFTLSKYCQEELSKYLPGMKIEHLYYPCPERQNKFDLNLFRKNKKIRFLGKWLRKYDIFEKLNSPYKKNDGMEKAYLNPKEYDRSFLNTIMFIDVKDASATTGVVECIQRNTPLLVCYHPAIVEYLGEDYPLYFRSLNEANEKINNFNLIIKTYEYLKNMDKTHIDGKTFINSFKNGEIYRNL